MGIFGDIGSVLGKAGGDALGHFFGFRKGGKVAFRQGGKTKAVKRVFQKKKSCK